MIEVIVVGEGQTEETFVRDVLAPPLAIFDIRLQPRLVDTSQTGRGGALSRDRVLRVLRNTLRERSDTYVTTFFDLYGLRGDFPGIPEARAKMDPLQKCRVIQDALAQAAVELSGCRADRFFAHIQPHEFEALLFSNVSSFGEVKSDWKRFVAKLQSVRDDATTPEHINDGPETHPSRRLVNLLQPRYRKVLHGNGVATSIGVARIRSECRHFDSWVTHIETLQPLR